MCLIIHHPAGHTVSRRDFADIVDRNPDGFGLMTASGGRLFTARTIGPLEEAYAMYSHYAAGRAAVLHWRFATHGAVTLDNAHPFTLTQDIAFVHNGMLSCGTPDADASDTAHMARVVLAPIARDNPDALFCPDTRAVLSPLIGTGNKLAVMDRLGRVSIFNRGSGVDYRGRWYSNTYAWDAPHAVAPRYTYQPRGVVSYPSHAPVVASTGLLGLSAGDPWDDADPTSPIDTLDTLDTLDRAALGGEEAVLQWCLDNPRDAVEVVSSWYDLDADDIANRLDLDPAAVAEWCYEIATATR
jgi:hypothetical protein